MKMRYEGQKLSGIREPSRLQVRKILQQSSNAESRIPRLFGNPSKASNSHYGDQKVDRSYGYRRIPTPMPKIPIPSGGKLTR